MRVPFIWCYESNRIGCAFPKGFRVNGTVSAFQNNPSGPPAKPWHLGQKPDLLSFTHRVPQRPTAGSTSSLHAAAHTVACSDPTRPAHGASPVSLVAPMWDLVEHRPCSEIAVTLRKKLRQPLCTLRPHAPHSLSSHGGPAPSGTGPGEEPGGAGKATQLCSASASPSVKWEGGPPTHCCSGLSVSIRPSGHSRPGCSPGP